MEDFGYKYICVFCGTETNADHCEVCQSFEGLMTPEEIAEVSEFVDAVNAD